MPEKKIKVLIVDDNQNVLDVTSEALALEGFETMTAINGKSALFKIKDASPDLVLLDVNLPDIDGFQICRQVRNDPRSTAIPVILMTGDRTVDIDLGFSVGADDCIIKPIDMDYLSDSILKLVRTKPGILVVEDDRQVCDMLTAVLTKQQMSVNVLHDGNDILEHIRKLRPSMVLLDITLAVPPNGIELCRMIKQEPSTKDIPVVMLTGENLPDAIEQCFSHGAEDYLFKPFTIPDLMVKVHKHLRTSKKGEKEK